MKLLARVARDSRIATARKSRDLMQSKAKV
jgi:hypothetical protein